MDPAEKLIRDARPPQTPLGAQAEGDLARILATPADGSLPFLDRRRRHPVRWALAAAAMLVVAVVIAATTMIRPSPAVAATPPLPTITPTGQDAAAVLRQLSALAAVQPDRSAQTQIASQWWALASDVDASGHITSSTVDPIRRVATLGDHGIESFTEYAIQPYDASGNPVTDPTAPVPGSQLGATTFVDADQQIFADPPPTNPAKIDGYFTSILPLTAPSAATRAFTGFVVLMSERVLTPAQNAALLAHLASLSDVQLLGTSTDRLGRPVVVFAAPAHKNDIQPLLMIAPDTGQILASEEIYQGTARTDIPHPAVTEYVAWELP